MLSFFLLRLDILLSLFEKWVLAFAAWEYRTSQIYPKCVVERAQLGLGCEGVGLRVDRAHRRFRYVCMPFSLPCSKLCVFSRHGGMVLLQSTSSVTLVVYVWALVGKV